MPFPRVKDYHKPGQPLVPNAYGVFYTVISVCYWFILSFLDIGAKESVALATSVLFGSNMGLLDDMIDLRWRYKAVLPVFAALPYIVLTPSDRTAIMLLPFGIIEFKVLFFLLFVPIMITVVTNTYNQLGGLNGLESLTGLIIMIGLAFASQNILLTIVPILCLVALSYLSFTGRAFIGNVGTFAIGLTLAVYSVLMNLKLFLLIAFTPFIVNSLLILFSNYVLHQRAETLLDEKGLLYSHEIRSLRTLILHTRHMSERKVVLVVCALVCASTIAALFFPRLI
jgi:UDP-N-acetylglucosamine--dolichyl-phosphate N-acetylglucosaminephosphotransferase